MEIRDFSRIIVKAGHKNYSSTISKISNLHSLAEYETVKQGVRKAAIIHIDSTQIIEREGEIRDDKLIFTPLRKSAYYQGFSHIHRPVNPGEPFFYYGCITTNSKDADIFKSADKEGNHEIIGELLGFPKCCREYFSKYFVNNYDPVWLDSNKYEGYYQCNSLLKYFGVRAVSHIPCSPICKGTLDIANKYLLVMRKIDSDTTDELITLLKEPAVWSSLHGVAEIDTEHFLGLTHTFPLDEERIVKFNNVSI